MGSVIIPTQNEQTTISHVDQLVKKSTYSFWNPCN